MADGPLFDAVSVRPSASKVLSVSELAAAVRGRLEKDFARVTVQGELGAVKLHSNGHLYCDLKDAGAVLNAVAWSSTIARWKSIPATGTLVVATGKITSYPQRSTYQMFIDTLEVAGIGALMQQLEELKQRLAAEGLFARERKRQIPVLPRRIGIITSPTGAVISDMLHRISDRCPRDVLLWPTAVQGATAAAEVAAAIEGFNRMDPDSRPDVLIVARGGGSFEDLMPFNTEIVARAVAASGIPVVSGVGHEPDYSLCDMAADVRAPTPSAAAEMVVPVREDMLFTLAAHKRGLEQLMRGLLRGRRENLDNFQRLLPDPRRVLLQLGLRLGELEERLCHSGPSMVRRRGEQVESLQRLLLAHDPKAPLGRGYVYLTRGGENIRDVQAPAGPVEVHFKDGVRQGELK